MASPYVERGSLTIFDANSKTQIQNMKRLFFLLPVCVLALSSCVKSEPLNPEADILTFLVSDRTVVLDSVITNENITIFITEEAKSKITAIAPIITTTPGARLEPASGTVLDFSTTQTYKVYPENGKGFKEYKVNFVSYYPLTYRFEKWFTTGAGRRIYETPYEEEFGIDFNIWSSGNKGIAAYTNAPYATRKSELPEEAREGLAAKMLTMVGPGKILGRNIPVVAGSLYQGEFILDVAKPIRSPKFGMPYSIAPMMPDSLQGYYKYRAGEGDFINEIGGIVPNMTDSCSIYGVLYEYTGERLTGENILDFDAENIVATAWVPRTTRTPGNDFVYFNVPFKYKSSYQSAADFEGKKYYFTLVFSSSFKGDYYEGTPGSLLLIDDVNIPVRVNTDPNLYNR